MEPKKVIVLGASGSIGQSTIDIIRSFPGHFSLTGVSVHKNTRVLEALKTEFSFTRFAVTEPAAAEQYPHENRNLIDFIRNTPADIVINGIAGAAGLEASLAVIEKGLCLGLANKESIVMAGCLLQKEAEKHGAEIIPIDSEHSAVFQLIRAHGQAHIAKIILTASGGPFRTWSTAALKNVTLEDALKHPTWNMGAKITIDSASLANKALEVIEAAQLFSLPPDRIQVAVHPSSIVHSMVQLTGGEVYAQLSPPDMRNPIFSALTYPAEPPRYLEPLDFSRPLDLHFEPPRMDDFPLLGLGFLAAEKKAGYPIAFNAANEEAVAAFLNRRIQFLQLADITAAVMQHDWTAAPADFSQIMQIDVQARRLAQRYIQKE